MKKALLKAIGFMLIIGIIYLVANIMSVFIVVAYILFSNIGESFNGITGFLDVLPNLINDYVLHMVLGANIISLLIIMLVFLPRKDKFLTYCKFRSFKTLDGLLVFGLGVFMNLLFVTLLTLVSSIDTFSDQFENYAGLMESLMNSPFYIMFLAIAISAPLFEEVIMRGIILNDFRKVTPLWLAILIQAIVFGIMHFNIVQGTYAAVLGVVLGLIYVVYNSLWMPIIFHFGFNLTSLLLDSVFGEEFTVLGIGLIGLIGSIVVIYTMKMIYNTEFYEEKEHMQVDEENDEVLDVEVS